ncbi:hypothetical protein [Natronogracilivirga saccharolytica]|uniref:Endonuclease/exonuclease/phosphatase domain-containing protein n=1 Tax=Natronogracilivirga saccharolytica TaxID=2812953 RepID=A0A8J7UVV2_9BACT|nr:hypothetical protein [Natronogracilivirga saccharolytica]MBP3192961.1 hypothetical protein [Natronogracilivirga saccharolytica]
MKIISWNIAQRTEAWYSLLESDADLALLQEASRPPSDLPKEIEFDDSPWETGGKGINRPWRAVVVKLSNRVNIEWLKSKSVEDAASGELAVSRLGSLAVAKVNALNPDLDFYVASIYSPWERPLDEIGSRRIYADASAHRILSDLSVLIGRQKNHRIIAAGDLNILKGYGEHGSAYWAERYNSVFERANAIGLEYIGPMAPNGRQATPWPKELPLTSKNVPTYYNSKQNPLTATRQLDFVFASKSISDKVKVVARNDPDTWGPSDHCRLEIEVQL